MSEFIKSITLKKILFILCILTVSVGTYAQQEKRPAFDPNKFEADMEQYITQKAGLTPQQASVFFPLFREMQKKQRAYFMDMRRFRMLDPKDNAACARAIAKMDNNDICIKKLQQEYHQKFMKVLPAGKVLEIIKAEDSFHRQAFKRVARHKNHR